MSIRSVLLAAATISVAMPATARAHPSVSVVMDNRGNVFYSDLRRVWMVTPSGAKAIAVPNVHSHELYVDSAGNLFGEHLWYDGAKKKWGHRVWKRAPDGSINDVIPAADGFRTGYSFVRDAAGTMYFAWNGERPELRKRSPGGSVALHSAGPFTDIRWMTAGSDGSIYLTDAGDLKRVFPDGNVKTLAAGIGSRSVTRLNVDKRHAVMGLWLDSAQNVYAARYGAGDVQRISPTGEVETVARSPLPWFPSGGMTSRNGDLWVLETSLINEVRLKRISPTGTVTFY